MFDPWTANIEGAMVEQEKWIASGKELGDPHGPVAQAAGAHEVLNLKNEIDGGNGFAVLAAIRTCLTNGLVAPDWLVYAFNRRYDAVNWCRAGSWDDPLSFGRPYPKGTNVAALRKARIGRFKVWNAACQIFKSNPDRPIDKSLFEEIGKQFGYGATLTETYYYAAKSMFGYCPKDSANSRGTRRSPANIRKTAGILKKAP